MKKRWREGWVRFINDLRRQIGLSEVKPTKLSKEYEDRYYLAMMKVYGIL
ncbi:MAG: hypothetical protein QXQ91_01260 [Nanopusillaceae archaeon]